MTLDKKRDVTFCDPEESLQDYFDELLSESAIELGWDVEDLVASSIPSQPSNAVITSGAVVESTVTSSARFAEPDHLQKEKLLRLLRPIIHMAPAALALNVTATVPHAFTAEPDTGERDVGADELQAASAAAKVRCAAGTLGDDWLLNGLPQWGQGSFDVLLVEVSGLRLAVPLVTLGQIQPLTDGLTPIFGQADWFLGLQPTHAGTIKVVNTAKFVMPERYDEGFTASAKLLITINGLPWGLAVDGVDQPIRLSSDAIKWRSDRSKRPWLAGIIKEHMCVLLDIPRMGQVLMEADKNGAKTPS